MIEASELRLGNWVKHLAQWSYRNNPEKEFCFQWEDTDWHKSAESLLSLDDIEPIPITTEILVRCGFEKWNDKEFSGKVSLHLDAWPRIGNRFDIDYRNDVIYLKSRYEQDNTVVQNMPHIKYLHQLQNLYFALTGEELTVTL